jgi:4-amino-4-deoxy-L-arabinose transferase-like glycosyltransferase
MRLEVPRLPIRGTTVLLALTAGLLLLRTGSVPLLGPDEPRYARVAIEMHRGGEWVTPTLQGEPWLEKPVLYYWLAKGAYSVLGETEAAARLPSVVAALLLVGATVLVGGRLYGRQVGLHAGYVLGTSVLVFVYGRAATMDMLLASLVTAATGLLGLWLLGRAGRLAIPAAYVLMALATLAKGPIGFLLPGLVVVGHLLATREWRVIPQLLSPVGIALFLLVAGPWYLMVYLDQGRAFVDVFLLAHNVLRFTSTIHEHPGPIFYYVPVILVGLFPWSGLTIPALAAVRPGRSRRDLFVVSWLFWPLAFFSLAGSKLPGYVLPCLAPMALMMGRALDGLAAGKVRIAGWSRTAGAVGLVIACLVAMAPLLLARFGEPGWTLLLPSGLWALIVTASVWIHLRANPVGASQLLRLGAAGFLILLTTSAPEILSHRESGRALFEPARGRDVLAWGAWRTAWMAGYFYNDARVEQVEGLQAITDAAKRGPVLVLCGPVQHGKIAQSPAFVSRVLAVGPRSNVLIRVESRPRPDAVRPEAS